MSVKVISEQQVTQEVLTVLLEHLSPSQLARLWASWQIGRGDYLTLRDQLFAQETVETLFEKVQTYQAGNS